MPVVDFKGARLWYDEAGQGEAVLLLHGGLGDSTLWEPVVPILAERFRVLRTDLRFYGRSAGPAVSWSWHEDVLGVLDELAIERAALVGLSLGGRIALELALDAPERLRALALVAPGLSGHDGAAYTAEQEARYEAAEAASDLDAAMEVDFEVWAPLGADDRMRQLWLATSEEVPMPEGVEPLPPRGGDAKPRLAELAVPTLVITAAHDPVGFREIGPLIAGAANARHVELDSDHYLTLREPELVGRTLLDFLTGLELKLVVREARREDAEGMARAHTASAAKAYGRPEDLERRTQRWQEVFDEPKSRPWLAEVDGEVVGVLGLGPDELHAIYVHPDWWGRGVGQALLDRAHELLAETCDEAELTVLVGNARARRFYERNGWRFAEQVVESHFGGEPTEVCKYRRRVRPQKL